MKTFRSKIRIAFIAVFVCANLASCSKEVIVLDDQNQEDYITVALNCVGEYLNITNSPLSRATGDDIYLIQVYSVDDNGYTIPYAYGNFAASLNGLTINLLYGKKYDFKVAIQIGGYQSDLPSDYYNTSFIYSSETGDAWSNYKYNDVPIAMSKEGFYGELDNYVPEEGKNIEIITKRVSYGAEFIAQNLSEGILEVILKSRDSYGYSRTVDRITLTPSILEHYSIYSFYDAYYAWKGTYTQTGTDPETGNPTYGYVDYSSTKEVTVTWTKENGDVIPFGTYFITFTRNVKTTIRINVAELPSASNGITVTKEDTYISDDKVEYNIEGGEIIEVPVNSES